MSDWNPSLYLHFAAERSRPAVELLARVPLENIEYIADLGCGPGNITALLHQRWPAARITGKQWAKTICSRANSLTLAESGNVVFTSRSNDREAIINCPQSFRAST